MSDFFIWTNILKSDFPFFNLKKNNKTLEIEIGINFKRIFEQTLIEKTAAISKKEVVRPYSFGDLFHLSFFDIQLTSNKFDFKISEKKS